MEGLTPSNITSTLYEEADVSGAPGVGSIPQLLRNARALMLTHTDQLTESLDRVSAKSLSTVMGSLKRHTSRDGGVTPP